MDLKDLKRKIQIAYLYVKLFNDYLKEKGLKADFDLFCEKRLGKEKVENDKKNLV